MKEEQEDENEGKGSSLTIFRLPKQNKLWLHSDDLDDFANWMIPLGRLCVSYKLMMMMMMMVILISNCCC